MQFPVSLILELHNFCGWHFQASECETMNACMKVHASLVTNQPASNHVFKMYLPSQTANGTPKWYPQNSFVLYYIMSVVIIQKCNIMLMAS